MKSPGKKKEDYIKENGRLWEQLEVWEVKDRQIRENLTAILQYSSRVHNSFNSAKPLPMTWIDIAFAMGELRADANYSMLLESREDMRREIERLKNSGKEPTDTP